jgi:3-keto-5-aminohexanoate cleavage enzyme
MNAMAVSAAGHVRTGLKDDSSLDYLTRTPATNAELVDRVAGLARVAGRPLSSAAEARATLGLPGPPTDG